MEKRVESTELARLDDVFVDPKDVMGLARTFVATHTWKFVRRDGEWWLWARSGSGWSNWAR
jgi:hypothetical protein